jgi:hypothetical protein
LRTISVAQPDAEKAIMAQPRTRDVASLFIAAKANALGHGNIAVRDRHAINGVLLASMALGFAAGFPGLADLAPKAAVSSFALAAGIATTVVIYLFTTRNPERHVRAQAVYEDISFQTKSCDATTAAGARLFQAEWERFRAISNEMTAGGTGLTEREVDKYERQARNYLPDPLQNLSKVRPSEIRPDEPPPWRGDEEDFDAYP